MLPPQGPKVGDTAQPSLALEGVGHQATSAIRGTWGVVLSRERVRTGMCVQPVSDHIVLGIVLIPLRGRTLDRVGGHRHPLQLLPLGAKDLNCCWV